eukprot:3864502-Prorocentrum_lima.AAC.1
MGMDLQIVSQNRQLSRKLIAYEKLGVMGWPVLLPHGSKWSRLLPRCMQFREVLQHEERCLSDSGLSALSGNMMH